MLALIVSYECKPGMREKYLEAIKAEGIDEKCRAEQGNLRWAYAFSEDDADKLYLLEQWESHEALKAHTETEHYAKMKEMKPEYVIDTVIERYEKE